MPFRYYYYFFVAIQFHSKNKKKINKQKLKISFYFIQFQTNQEKINIIKTQKHFSKSFNILLNSKSTDIDSTMIDATTNLKTNHETNDNHRAKQLRQYLKNIIQLETEATEDRIDQYKKLQMTNLRTFREKAEQDYQDILR